MRVAFFLGFPNPFPGAGWARIVSFARHARARGHRVDVVGIVTPTTTARAGVRSWNGLTLWNVCPAAATNTARSAVVNVATSLVTLAPLARTLRPDVSIISVPNGPFAVGAYSAARGSGSRVVIDYRDEWEDYAIGLATSRRSRTVLERLKDRMTEIYRGADLVCTVTEACADRLRSRGVPQVRLVPNGADTNLFRPYERAAMRRSLGLRENDLVLVYNGTVGGYYRLDLVVNAISELGEGLRERVRLLVAGPDPDAHVAELLSLAGRAGLRDGVRYLGVFHDARGLARVLSAADVGLIPYDDNPLWDRAVPAKFYEYGASGIPVIATVRRGSVLAQTIRDNELGETVPPLDAGKLAGAIRNLLTDGPRRQRLGRNSRDAVVTSYDREAIAAKFWQEVWTVLPEGDANRVTG